MMLFPMYANADSVKIHTKPNASSPHTGSVSRGARLTATDIDAVSGCWAKVSADGVDGWCNLQDLMPVSGEGLPWLVFAHSQIGISNTTAAGRARIIEYMKTVTNKNFSEKAKKDPMGTEWCACFMNYCMLGVGQEGKNSAMANSWKNWGTASRPLQNGEFPISARVGDIAVGERGVPGGDFGHVAIFLTYDKTTDRLLLLGGNQSQSPLEPGGEKAVRYTWYPREWKDPYGKLVALRHR